MKILTSLTHSGRVSAVLRCLISVAILHHLLKAVELDAIRVIPRLDGWMEADDSVERRGIMLDKNNIYNSIFEGS